MFLDRLAKFVVDRKIKKSGLLDTFSVPEGHSPWPNHRDFMNHWDKTSPSLFYDDKAYRNLLFGFQFNLLTTVLHHFEPIQVADFKTISASFFNISIEDIEKRISEAQTELSRFDLLEEKRKLIPDYMELLSDTHLILQDATEYTFDEATSLMPVELGYPQKNALAILDFMGFPRIDPEKSTEIFV